MVGEWIIDGIWIFEKYTSFIDSGPRMGSTKGQHLPGNDPVGISVLDSLPRLVLGDVQRLGIVESAVDGALQPFQHVQEREAVARRLSDAGISERHELIASGVAIIIYAVVDDVVRAEAGAAPLRFRGDEMKSVFRRHFEIEDAVSGGEKGGVHSLVRVETSHVDQLFVG